MIRMASSAEPDADEAAPAPLRQPIQPPGNGPRAPSRRGLDARGPIVEDRDDRAGDREDEHGHRAAP